ncbi:MAG TPA: ice-binding family protein [Polyangiaceae bacterium]|nr:ice-binding family protein [Polyangiaceae bacterium]
MLRLTNFLRHAAIAAALPAVVFGTACSDTSAGSADGASAGSSGADASGGNGAAGTNSASGNGTSAAASGGTSSVGGPSGAAGAAGEAGSATTLGGPAPVVLGNAANYVIIAESAISNVPSSIVTGDIALSPAAASYVTGLSLTKAGVKWTSPQVIGGVFAADNDPPTPVNLTTAIGDMQAAYTDAAGRSTPNFLNLEGGAIGGLTLSPGLYRWTTTVTVPSDLTLAGSESDTWIFQITGDLKLSSASALALSGGARAKNIVWQVAGGVELGAESHLEGIVLAKTAITLGSGASINGRLFAQTAVSIAGSTITAP